MRYTVFLAALFAALWAGESHAQANGPGQVDERRPVDDIVQVDITQVDIIPADIAQVVGPGQVHRLGQSDALDSDVQQQEVGVSGGKAFALSLVLPGLGHRYVHGGDWNGWASIFAVGDASLWAALAGSEWRRDHLVDSYTALAAAHAEAQTDGKDRDFFLNLASYRSSDEFVEAQLRSRNWGRIDYADDPAFQWEWDSEGNYIEYRRTREDAESLRRRRTFIITALVANRLISGFTALRAAGRVRAPRAEFSFAAPPAGASAPLARFSYRF